MPPEELVEFNVDRPFIFLIRDIETRAILFCWARGKPKCLTHPLLTSQALRNAQKLVLLSQARKEGLQAGIFAGSPP